MPTGYTAGVNNGSVTTLRDYALTCARAFGALIELRDEPADAPIPDKFEAHTGYHDKKLAEATARLAELQAMTDIDKQAGAATFNATNAAEHAAHERHKTEIRNRYQAMLAQVIQWSPPTGDHEKLKDFMVAQLRDSIDFDAASSDLPQALSPDEWHAKTIEREQWSVQYHTEQRTEAIRRAAERTAWVKALRDSLPAEQGAAQ